MKGIVWGKKPANLLVVAPGKGTQRGACTFKGYAGGAMPHENFLAVD